MLVMLFYLLVLSSSIFGLKERCPSYPQPVSLDISTQPSIQQLLKRLDGFISDYVTSAQVPGFAATIVYDQQVIFGKGYGKSNYFDPNSPPPNMDTITRIASISKTFTDLFLYQLRDNGLVHLDDLVVKYLPKFSMKNPYQTNRQITLRELASHTAGIPREIPCPWEVMKDCSEDEILAALSQQYVLMPQYYRPHYSNLGIALLGRALEKVAGQRYEDYMKQKILDPMGMNASGFKYDDYTKKHLGVGVTYFPNGTAVPAKVEELGWGNPMGGMFASIRDMATYMSFLFRTNQKAGGNQILDGFTIMEFLQPVMLTHDGTAGFGIPWEFNYTGSHWVTSKAGELDGYRSQIALVPELKLGVFATALVTDVSDPTVLTIPIIDQLIDTFTQVLNSLQPTPPVPPNAHLFTGEYFNLYDSSDITTIILSQGALVAHTQGNRVNLTSSGYDPLVLRMMISDPSSYSCRGLDDGVEYELIYFALNSRNDHAAQVVIMGETYYFLH